MSAILLLSAVLSTQAAIIDLEHFLGSYIDLDDDEIRSVREGRIVVKLLPSSDGLEIAVFGIARVTFTADFFRSQFRSIETFKKSYAVPQVGRFGEPPVPGDLDGLSVPREDLEDLRRCRAGDCKLRLSSESIREFREHISWSQPDALDRAEQLFKEILVRRALAYRQGGSEALAAYDDKDDVVPLRRDFDAILRASSYLLDYVPELVEMMERYPEYRLDGAEDFLYWSKEEIGLKPVISLTHAILYSWRHTDGEEELIIASKQLYASHYFDSSLGLTAVLEVEDGASAPGHYLIYLNRSRSLDLGGFFGGLKRSVVGGRVLEGLKTNLLYTRARLEAIHRAMKSRARIE